MHKFSLILEGNNVTIKTESELVKEIFSDVYGEHGLVVTEEPSNIKCLGLREANENGEAVSSVLAYYEHYEPKEVERIEVVKLLLGRLENSMKELISLAS